MKNNRNVIWLKTEYKRAAMQLPLILKKAIILTVLCLTVVGMIAFCTGKVQKTNDDVTIRIGYAADENAITELAVSYVENMESVKKLCSLIKVSEEDGKKKLNEGELDALIVLPNDVMNEILSGSNTPAKLYLAQSTMADFEKGGLNTVASMLFKELADAGIGMLGTAQAQIYASSVILNQTKCEISDINEIYDDINKFNLGMVTGRENIFDIKNISITENDTYAVYFGSAIFTIYVLFSGLFMGNFCRRNRLEQDIADKRLGVKYAIQLLFRSFAGIMPMIIVEALPFMVFVIPYFRSLIAIKLSFKGIITFLMITIFIIIYNMFIYQLVEKRKSALVVMGVAAIFQSYMCGCMIPLVLMPESIKRAGSLLPAAFIKMGFTTLFTGKTREIPYIIKGLGGWSAALFTITLAVIYMQGKAGERIFSSDVLCKKKKIHVPSVMMVMIRRLLYRKSIWVCMLVIIIMSVGIIGMEKKSQSKIVAAVYDEQGAYISDLTSYNSLVCFESYESEADVREAVLKGNAECGYILPKGLSEDMTAKKANRAVTVYQDEDAIVTSLVNEVIYEKIFYRVSLAWYEDYIIRKVEDTSDIKYDMEKLMIIIDDSFMTQINAGSTFSFEIESMNHENKDESEAETTYPVFAVMIVTIILCALYGVAQVQSDMRKKRFYKRNRAVMAAITISLPVIMGLITGILTMTVVFLLTL